MRTNRNIIYLSLAVIVLFFTSCSKSFLDTAPTDKITPEQLQTAAKQQPSVLNGTLRGLYTAMYIDGSGGTDLDHDDFGQKGYDIFSDMLCSDMVLDGVNYGWYAPIVRYQATVDFTRTEDYIPWRYYYYIVFGANSIIDGLGGTDVNPDSLSTDAKHIMGQAKAMRAYAYFYLSQFYSIQYGDGSAKILPIYTTATGTANNPKSTTKEVFDLIISDLTEAVSDLSDFERDSKGSIDKTVAEGLLSYALAYRGTTDDLKQVVSLTSDIMASYPLTSRSETVAQLSSSGKLLNSDAGFNNIATPSWMWGADITTSANLDLVSWWGQVDVFTYSYAWAGDLKTIDEGLYNSIRSDDIRKGQFDFDNFDGAPVNKFFDPNRVIGGQRTITDDYIYMRSDEFYLLNAEAQAKLGQDALAKESLKKLLDLRLDDDSYINTLSGQALKDEIYLQTRIELWGEGKSYLAMKRDKATITRGANHLYFAGQSFKFDDPKLTFVIPQQEVLNNPVLNN